MFASGGLIPPNPDGIPDPIPTHIQGCAYYYPSPTLTRTLATRALVLIQASTDTAASGDSADADDGGPGDAA